MTHHFVTMNLDKVEAFEKEIRTTEDHSYVS